MNTRSLLPAALLAIAATERLGAGPRNPNSDGYLSAAPRPEKHQRTGVWQQSAKRKARRAAQVLQGVTDLEEYAWGIIANAGGGDWTRESAEWQEAAARFREEYHAKLSCVVVKRGVQDPAPAVLFTDVVALEGTLPDAIKALSRAACRTQNEDDEAALSWLRTRLEWGIARCGLVDGGVPG